MIEVPTYITIGGITLTSAGTLFAFYKAGVDRGAKKNGYIEREECRVNVNKMTQKMDKGFTDVHEKINEANEGIAFIKGKMDNQ